VIKSTVFCVSSLLLVLLTSTSGFHKQVLSAKCNTGTCKDVCAVSDRWFAASNLQDPTTFKYYKFEYKGFYNGGCHTMADEGTKINPCQYTCKLYRNATRDCQNDSYCTFQGGFWNEEFAYNITMYSCTLEPVENPLPEEG
jgi:hypothetical protein